MLAVQYTPTDGLGFVLFSTVSKPWNSTEFDVHTKYVESIAPFFEVTICEHIPLVILNMNSEICFGHTGEATDLVSNRFPVVFQRERPEPRRYLSHSTSIRNTIRDRRNTLHALDLNV